MAMLVREFTHNFLKILYFKVLALMYSRTYVLRRLQMVRCMNGKRCNYKKDYAVQMTEVAEDGVVFKAAKELRLGCNIILVVGSQEAEITRYIIQIKHTDEKTNPDI